jgi:hypothetical protein
LGTPGSWLALLLGCTGCIVSNERGIPLYPDPEVERARVDQVATLGGYVATVDGRDVRPLGTVFELLPGCHRVETPEKWGAQNSTGGLIAITGRHLFAVPMVSGRYYQVTSPPIVGGAIGRVTLRMDESDASGSVLRTFPPDLAACH